MSVSAPGPRVGLPLPNAPWSLALALPLATAGVASFGALSEVAVATLALSLGTVAALALAGRQRPLGRPVSLSLWHGVWLAGLAALLVSTGLAPARDGGTLHAARLVGFFALAALLSLDCDGGLARAARRALAAGVLAGSLAALLAPGPSAAGVPPALLLALPLLLASARHEAGPARLLALAAAACALAATGLAGIGGGRDAAPPGYALRVAVHDLGVAPLPAALGRGLDSLPARAHAVDPADLGSVLASPGDVRVAAELLGWWHDGGLVALAALLAVLAATASALAARLRSPRADPAARWQAGGVLGGLLLWLAFQLGGVETRSASVQLVFALLLGLAWRLAPPVGPRRPVPCVAAGACLLLLAACGAAVRPAFSEAQLWRAQEARRAGDAPRAARAAAQALVWSPGNLRARYLRLELAAAAGDLAQTEAQHAALSARAPHYRRSDGLYGRALLDAGRREEALGLLREQQQYAPFDWAFALDVPALAFALRRREVLDASLEHLLVHALLALNQREDRQIELELSRLQGQPALRIHPGPGVPSLTIATAWLPGLLFGGQPGSAEQARAMLARGLDEFLVRELGARGPLVRSAAGDRDPGGRPHAGYPGRP